MHNPGCDMLVLLTKMTRKANGPFEWRLFCHTLKTYDDSIIYLSIVHHCQSMSFLFNTVFSCSCLLVFPFNKMLNTEHVVSSFYTAVLLVLLLVKNLHRRTKLGPGTESLMLASHTACIVQEVKCHRGPCCLHVCL